MAREAHTGADRPVRLTREDARFAIVAARWHAELTEWMLESARKELLRAGARERNVHVLWVPGSFELPIACAHAAIEVDSVIAFGVVIKGDTSHDHWVAHGAISGLVQASLAAETPIHLGVLTCDTLEQARARALPAERGGEHDKGREVARAALETLAALDEIADWD